LAAELVDLGLGGASVATSEPLPVGMTIKLRIDAPALWEPLEVPGRVVWSRPRLDGTCQNGVKFDSDSPILIAILVELIGARSQF